MSTMVGAVGFEWAALTNEHPRTCMLGLMGDVIGLGISHPCTTFDKWRLLYVLDDQFEATEGILTFF